MTQRQAERLLDEQTQRMLQPSARLVICGPCWTLRAYHPHCQLKITNAFAEFSLLATNNCFPHQPSFADLLGEWEGGLVKLLRTLACTCLAWGANGRYHTWASCALGETVFFFFRFLSLSLSLSYKGSFVASTSDAAVGSNETNGARKMRPWPKGDCFFCHKGKGNSCP